MSSTVELDRARVSRRQGDLLLQEAPSIWRHVPRGAWLASIIGAGLIALSMWAGVAVGAAEYLSAAADPATADPTAAATPLLAVFAVFVPSVVVMVAAAAIGGVMALRAAALRPTERAASRFAAAVWPALAFIIGSVGVAVAVAYVLSGVTVWAAGLSPDWDLLPRAGLLIAGIGAVTGLAGLSLATAVAGAMLRPHWEHGYPSPSSA